MFKNIVANNRLGIWLDHSKANLMAYSDLKNAHTIKLGLTHQSKMAEMSHSESGMHHKEQQYQEAFYKQIGAEILKYDSVILFGPTNANNGQNNFIKKGHHFDEIYFEI